jgi:hypothetical protein
MRKRDRTSSERAFDKLVRTGIMLLGEQPPAPAEPNAFRHVLRANLMGRKGQHCRILKQSGILAQIEFEDGFIAQVNRATLRRT